MKEQDRDHGRLGERAHVPARERQGAERRGNTEIKDTCDIRTSKYDVTDTRERKKNEISTMLSYVGRGKKKKSKKKKNA